MSQEEKKEVPQAQEPEANTPETNPPESAAPQTPGPDSPADTGPETASEEPESYTVTKEQMEKMEALAKLVAESSDKYLRLAAEYDNYRKRTAREKEGIYDTAKADTIRPFLEVYDNLARGAAQCAQDDPHRQGLELILRQLEDVLGKLGVTEIEALGQPFDPARHNAVMHVEDEDAGENTVVEVFQKGFMLGEKVLRFAMVKVAN